MKKIINQGPIVRYRASVSEIFSPDFWNRTFSAESVIDYLGVSGVLSSSRLLGSSGLFHLSGPFGLSGQESEADS